MIPLRRSAESAPAATYRDADATLVTSGDRGARARRLRLAAFAPAIAFLVAILMPPLNHDVAAVMDFSRRWLAGEALYTDLIDVNLGRTRTEDTREQTAFYEKITAVREALRRVEKAGATSGYGGVEDR